MAKPNKDGWKELTNPTEIIDYINNYTKYDKWDALNYFGSYGFDEKNPEVFLSLFNSGHYSAQELFERYAQTRRPIKHFKPFAYDIIINKIKEYKPWQEMTTATEILNCKNRFIDEATEILDKLNYFADKDKAIYLQILLSKPQSFYFTKYSVDQLASLNEEAYEYLASNFDKTLNSIRIVFQDISARAYIKRFKPLLIKCAMTSPEDSFLIFKQLLISKCLNPQDLSEYSKESIQKLPPLIQEVLNNPENVWKLHTHPELIHYNIPKGKEWEALEYFASVDEHKFLKVAGLIKKDSYYTKPKILEHYKDTDISTLPIALQNYLQQLLNKQQATQIKSAQKEKTLIEKQSSWIDRDGNLVQFFKLANKFSITAKSEYVDLAYYFLNTDMSAAEFCQKYKINNSTGFRAMLRKLADEDENFKRLYEEKATIQSQEFVNNCRSDILNITEHKVSIKDIIHTHPDSRNFANLIRISSSLFNDPSLTEQFVYNILEYYSHRANSYDDNSIEIKDFKNLLTFKEVAFIAGRDSITKMAFGNQIDIAQCITNALSESNISINAQIRPLLFDQKTGLKHKLRPYSYLFLRKPYLNNGSAFRLPSGEIVKVTSEMLDMADSYCANKHLFKSHFTMTKIIKAIAEGKINNQEETEEYKKGMIPQKQQQSKSCSTLEQYLNLYQ